MGDAHWGRWDEMRWGRNRKKRCFCHLRLIFTRVSSSFGQNNPNPLAGWLPAKQFHAKCNGQLLCGKHWKPATKVMTCVRFIVLARKQQTAKVQGKCELCFGRCHGAPFPFSNVFLSAVIVGAHDVNTIIANGTCWETAGVLAQIFGAGCNYPHIIRFLYFS